MSLIEIKKTNISPDSTPNTETYYRINEKGMYEVKKKENKNGTSESRSILTSAKLKKVEKIKYLNDHSEYKFHLIEHDEEFKIRGSRKQISSVMKGKVSIYKDTSFLPLVSTVINHLETEKEINYINVSIPSGNGLFLVNDGEEELIKDFEILDKIKYEENVTKEEAKEQMNKVYEFMDFYYEKPASKSFIKMLFANKLYSQFSYIRKQKGLQTPIIILEGTSNTGKTAGLSLGSKAIGLREDTELQDDCYMLGSDFKKSNFDILMKTTHPLDLDEGQQILDFIAGKGDSDESRNMSELLKGAVDGKAGVVIRKVMTDSTQRGEFTNIYGNRSLFVASNYTMLDLTSEAWKKRTIVYVTDKKQQKSQEKSGQITEYFHKLNNTHKIGNYILQQLRLMNYEEMKEKGFFEPSFSESAKNLFDWFCNEINFEKLDDVKYYKEEDMKSTIDSQLEDMKEFMVSSLEYRAKYVDTELLEDVENWFSKIFPVSDQFSDLPNSKQQIVKKLKVVSETSRLSFLHLLKTKDKAYILKNAFLKNYRKFSSRANNVSRLEAGDFEELFEAIGGEVSHKISYKRKDGKGNIETVCNSGIIISISDLFDFLVNPIYDYQMQDKKEKEEPNLSKVKKQIKSEFSKQSKIFRDELFEKINASKELVIKALNQLMKVGDIYEPKKNVYMWLG